MTSKTLSRRALSMAAALLFGVSNAGMAQTPAAPGPESPKRDFGTLTTLLEKTIFKVDVLWLELSVDSGTAARLEHLVAGREYSDSRADSIAQLVFEAPSVEARITFERDISLEQFLKGIDEDMWRAVRAGWLSEDDYDRVREGLPHWFAFLAERRVREGDQISYRIARDSLRTTYRSADGEVLLDQTDVGEGSRESVLGTYLAPRSNFRKGLIESLFQPTTPTHASTVHGAGAGANLASLCRPGRLLYVFEIFGAWPSSGRPVRGDSNEKGHPSPVPAGGVSG